MWLVIWVDEVVIFLAFMFSGCVLLSGFTPMVLDRRIQTYLSPLDPVLHILTTHPKICPCSFFAEAIQTTTDNSERDFP